MTPTLKLTASSLTRALTDLTKRPAFGEALNDAASRAADRVEPAIGASGGSLRPEVSRHADEPAIKIEKADAEIVREVLT